MRTAGSARARARSSRTRYPPGNGFREVVAVWREIGRKTAQRRRASAEAPFVRSRARMAQSLLLGQAAELLGVSRRTVYYRIRDGRLRTIRVRCGSQRVLVESMEELLRQEAARLRARRTRRATTARRVAAVESCAEGVVRGSPMIMCVPPRSKSCYGRGRSSSARRAAGGRPRQDVGQGSPAPRESSGSSLRRECRSMPAAP